MKVLLNPTTQFLRFPELARFLKERLYPYNRMNEIIEWIENNAIDRFTTAYSASNFSINTPDKIIHFYSDESINEYVLNGHIFQIIEVDISEPWMIEMDDYGYESILYLDTIEKDINFYGCEPYTEANFKETY